MEAWGRKCYFHASVENTAQKKNGWQYGATRLSIDGGHFFSSGGQTRRPVV
jgi:hypothetical protein